jgi:outer membrane protein assembly factor BamB
MMRVRRSIFVIVTVALASAMMRAQVGRGGSQWPTAQADAQRTSWIRTDPKIFVEALAKPGFEMQWKVKLENQPRGPVGLLQGVSASGVTLFIPMSLVTGSSNVLFALDNDTGYVVWQRSFGTLPAATAECHGGMTAAATRIVRLDASATAGGGGVNFGGGNAGYRSVIGEPGQGVPLEGRGGRGAPAPGAPNAGPARGAPDVARGAAPDAARGAAPDAARGAAPDAARGAAPGTAPAAQPGRGRGNQPPAERIPGAPAAPEAGGFGFLARPSGVAYVIAGDGVLHVVGLASGKDIQHPAEFLPPNAKWSSPISVGTTLYAATSPDCGGAPSAVWAIDLDSDAKPVVSWKTNGGPVVGSIAFTTDGTLIAAIGRGQASGEGKANAIVALDSKTLQLKDWFTQPNAEFVTGPTIIRQNDKDVVGAATKDGRVLLLDASSLGGADHATPLYASKPLIKEGGSVSGDALAAWQQPNGGPSWILMPVRGGVDAPTAATNGLVSSGAVVALKLGGSAGSVWLEPVWVSHNLASPATPLIVNGVVFALALGSQATPPARTGGAVLHAYEGATGRRLWTSAQAMTGIASPGSMWSTLGQVYVGMRDGTLYAFGFNDERSPFVVK